MVGPACVPPQMREKKKLVAGLKEQLKSLKMDTAVETRYLAKDRVAWNEALRRLENTGLSEMRRDLTLVQQQIEIEVGSTELSGGCWAFGGQ